MIEINPEDYKKEFTIINSLREQRLTIEYKIKHQEICIIKDVLKRLGLDKEVYMKEKKQNYVKGEIRVSGIGFTIEFYKSTDKCWYKDVYMVRDLKTDLDDIVEFLQYKFISAEKLKEKINNE